MGTYDPTTPAPRWDAGLEELRAALVRLNGQRLRRRAAEEAAGQLMPFANRYFRWRAWDNHGIHIDFTPEPDGIHRRTAGLIQPHHRRPT